MNSSGVEFQGTYPWISRNLSKFYLLGRYLLSLQKKVVFPALKFTSYPSKIFYLTAIFKLSLVSYIQYAKQKFHVLFTALVKVYDNLPCRLYLNLQYFFNLFFYCDFPFAAKISKFKDASNINNIWSISIVQLFQHNLKAVFSDWFFLFSFLFLR